MNFLRDHGAIPPWMIYRKGIPWPKPRRFAAHQRDELSTRRLGESRLDDNMRTEFRLRQYDAGGNFSCRRDRQSGRSKARNLLQLGNGAAGINLAPERVKAQQVAR